MKVTRYAIALLALSLSTALIAQAQNESWKRLSAHGKRPGERRKSDVAVPNGNGARALNQQVDRIEKQPHSKAVAQKTPRSTSIKNGSTAAGQRNPPINFSSTSRHSSAPARKSGGSRAKVGSVHMGR